MKIEMRFYETNLFLKRKNNFFFYQHLIRNGKSKNGLGLYHIIINIYFFFHRFFFTFFHTFFFLNIEDIEKYKDNCWLMSPPCQPYTRGGKSLDDKDQRSSGLLHLIEIMPKLSDPPNYIFLENVLNFEVNI